MMEVKQNTQVDLNDLLTSGKNIGNDEVDDADMTDITERTHDLDCDVIKTNGMKGFNLKLNFKLTQFRLQISR